MRGLAFPTGALLVHDDSHENDPEYFGSPVPTSGPGGSGGDAGVPIDPALVGALGGVNGGHEKQGEWVRKYDNSHRQSTPSGTPLYYEKYGQGPQGDPFAPQPPAFYPEEEVVQIMRQKPMKRKRKIKREEECGFCQGNDKNNKNGEPEVMITCSECGRSGHPTCMDLGAIGDILRSYEWKCIECKTCELCSEKGDDERILFCDHCDRGWHMDCLVPPLKESPPGKWHCPQCPGLPPPFPQQHYADEGLHEEQSNEEEMEVDPALNIDPALREVSVASSSYSIILPSPRKNGRNKGKLRAITTDESEVEEIYEEEAEVKMPSTSKRGPRYVSNQKRNRGRQRSPSMPVSDDVPPPSPPLRPQKRMRVRLSTPQPPPQHERMVVRLRLPAKGKGKARESDDDGEPRGMFDGVLSTEDRDTSRTIVSAGDKERFEKSRVTAETKLIPPKPSEPPDLSFTFASSSFRPLRSTILQLQRQSIPVPRHTSPSPSTPSTPSLPSLKFDTTGLRIRTIRFGAFDIQTWYDAPFPEEFSNIPDGRLWICEFCLKYMKSRFGAQRHRMKCKSRHPPGDEIYRDGNISIFEVDGRKNKIYCQNLCLLSKMFLDHKSLFYDVEPFLFYVVAEIDDIGARFIGYFSKEKRSPKDLNLSCIMTLPVRQRRGWGNFLIDFSYLLSKKERRTGTPERPLSALGALGYRNYWTLALMRYLKTSLDNPRMEDISAATSMTIEDIYATLVDLNMIVVKETRPSVRPSPGQSIKVSRGRKNGVARRHLQRTQTKDDEKLVVPATIPTDYEIIWDRNQVTEYLETWEQKGYMQLRPEKLKWSPFLLARTTNGTAVSKPTPAAKTPESVQPSSSSEVANTCAETPKAISKSPAEISTPTSGYGLMLSDSAGARALNGLEKLADVALRAAGLTASDTIQQMAPIFVAPESPTPLRGLTNGHALGKESYLISPSLPKPNPLLTEEVLGLFSPTDARPITPPRPDDGSPGHPADVNGFSGQTIYPADTVVDDAQLAKQLALEIDNPKRSLRSSSVTTQATPAVPSPKNAGASKSTPKKRNNFISPSRSESPVLTRSTTRSMARTLSQGNSANSSPRVLRGRTVERNVQDSPRRKSSAIRSSSRLNSSSPMKNAVKRVSAAIRSPQIIAEENATDQPSPYDGGQAPRDAHTEVAERITNGHHLSDDTVYTPVTEEEPKDSERSYLIDEKRLGIGDQTTNNKEPMDLNIEDEDEDAEGEPDTEIDV